MLKLIVLSKFFDTFVIKIDTLERQRSDSHRLLKKGDSMT